MATIIDPDSVRQAYDAVRDDTVDVTWAVFKYEENYLVCGAVGQNHDEFMTYFTDDDRMFAYIRFETGDEHAKHFSKFIFVSWIGPKVSVLKKARVSLDKGELKKIIQQFSVELLVDSKDQLTVHKLKAAL